MWCAIGRASFCGLQTEERRPDPPREARVKSIDTRHYNPRLDELIGSDGPFVVVIEVDPEQYGEFSAGLETQYRIDVSSGFQPARGGENIMVHDRSITVPFDTRGHIHIPGLRTSTIYEFDVRVVNSNGITSATGIVLRVQMPAKVQNEDELEFYDVVESEPVMRPKGLPTKFGLFNPQQANEEEWGEPAEDAAEKEDDANLVAAGFRIEQQQLDHGSQIGDVERAVEAILALPADSEDAAPLSKQQAVRLVLGMNLDAQRARHGWEEISDWRKSHGMDEVAEIVYKQLYIDDESVPVRFPYEAEVLDNVMAASVAALVTPRGHPVTFMQLSRSGAVGEVDLSLVERWSRTVFEYLRVWVMEESERTGDLKGHILVFDIGRLTIWNLTFGDLVEKVKAALLVLGFHVETCYHTYLINATTTFSMVWKILQQFVSERAKARITVDADIPPSLIKSLGGDQASALRDIRRVMEAADQGCPLPPRRPHPRTR